MIYELVMTARSILASWLGALSSRVEVPGSYWTRAR